jgi:L-ascorbate metabolism protein UlaG (beta-lactamase superfamily)
MGTSDAGDISSRAAVQFIGNATLLIRSAGFTVLTDPNFVRRGERIHIGYMMHTVRLTDPALQIRELPQLDLCVVSHIHEDHFDKVVQRELDKGLPIISTHQGASIIRKKGFTGTRPLWPWRSISVSKGNSTLRITAVPATHAPAPASAFFPSVIGSVLEFTDGGTGNTFRLYQSGDTLLYKGFEEIGRRFPQIDVAVLHLGGTRVGPLMVTMNAQQGLEAMRLLRPRTVLPVHHNDYPVMKESVEVFRSGAAQAGFGDRVVVLQHGETYNAPQTAG